MPKKSLMCPIEGIEQLPQLTTYVRADNTASYLVRMAFGLSSFDLGANAQNYDASSSTRTQKQVAERVNEECANLGISPPVFELRPDHAIMRTVTAYALEFCMANPEIDYSKLPQVLALRSFILDGIVGEACEIDGVTAELVLDQLADRHRDHTDLFALDHEAMRRHSTLRAEAMTKDSVMLLPGAQKKDYTQGDGKETEHELDLSVNYDKIIESIDPKDHELARVVVVYVVDGLNFDEIMWKELERRITPGIRKVMKSLSKDPRFGSHEKTRYNLVADTVGMPTLKKIKGLGIQ